MAGFGGNFDQFLQVQCPHNGRHVLNTYTHSVFRSSPAEIGRFLQWSGILRWFGCPMEYL